VSDVRQRGLDEVPSRRLDARARRIRGALTVAGPENAFELSETAELIFRSANGKRTVSEIGAIVAERYDVDAGTAAADALELLAQLEREGAIEWRDGAGGAA